MTFKNYISMGKLLAVCCIGTGNLIAYGSTFNTIGMKERLWSSEKIWKYKKVYVAIEKSEE